MHAFGHPESSDWTSSAKDMVGCALGPARLWFTTGYGILNEVYYPRATFRRSRSRFIVADGNGFWVEVKRLDNYRVRRPSHGIRRLRSSTSTIASSFGCGSPRSGTRCPPDRGFVDGRQRPATLRAACTPSRRDGSDNFAEAGVHGGRRVLWAEHGPFGLALAAANEQQGDAWRATSAGYVGASDGWQDFARNGALSWRFDTAAPANVALIGELP